MDTAALEQFYLFIRKTYTPETLCRWEVAELPDGTRTTGPYPSWPNPFLYIHVCRGADHIEGEETLVTAGEVWLGMQIELADGEVKLRSRPVLKKGKAVWHRAYHADIVDPTYRLPGNRLSLFREVLLPARGQFPYDNPARQGQAHTLLGSTGYEYFCDFSGDFSSFHTTERIIHQPTGRELYRYTDSGGLISREFVTS